MTDRRLLETTANVVTKIPLFCFTNGGILLALTVAVSPIIIYLSVIRWMEFLAALTPQ